MKISKFPSPPLFLPPLDFEKFQFPPDFVDFKNPVAPPPFIRMGHQNNLSFSELLDLGNSVIVHHKNFQVLMTEIYKVKNGIAQEIMKEI